MLLQYTSANDRTAALGKAVFSVAKIAQHDSSDDDGPAATGADIVAATVYFVSCNLRFF